jgi:hypothetical protein
MTGSAYSSGLRITQLKKRNSIWTTSRDCFTFARVEGETVSTTLFVKGNLDNTMKAIASRSIRPSPPHSPGTSDSCAANTAGRCWGWHQGGGCIPKLLGNRTLRALRVHLLTSLPAVAAGPDWQWREDPGRSLELRSGEVLVARFLIDPRPADPHFDVLAKGRSFTHRYRVLVHDGTWTPQRLNEEAAAFAR